MKNRRGKNLALGWLLQAMEGVLKCPTGQEYMLVPARTSGLRWSLDRRSTFIRRPATSHSFLFLAVPILALPLIGCINPEEKVYLHSFNHHNNDGDNSSFHLLDIISVVGSALDTM